MIFTYNQIFSDMYTFPPWHIFHGRIIRLHIKITTIPYHRPRNLFHSIFPFDIIIVTTVTAYHDNEALYLALELYRLGPVKRRQVIGLNADQGARDRRRNKKGKEMNALNRRMWTGEPRGAQISA